MAVDRVPMRPKCHVYMRGIRDPLPIIPIPLRQDEPDVGLDLRRAFELVYDRARYDVPLRHEVELDPPFPPEHRSWAAERVTAPPA